MSCFVLAVEEAEIAHGPCKYIYKVAQATVPFRTPCGLGTSCPVFNFLKNTLLPSMIHQPLSGSVQTGPGCA